MKTRIYVAGPYTKGDPEENAKNAISVGNKLMEAGYAPFVPHLTHYWHGLYPQPYQSWIDYDNEWLPPCHAVLRLPGVSSGADDEVCLANELGIPVYHNLDTLMREVPAVRHDVGDPRFKKLLDETWELHCRKNADYGAAADNFANYNRAERFGVPGYMSALLRLGEKMSRLETFCKDGSLANEGIEDTLKDMAAISLISLVLHREHQAKQGDAP